MFIRTRKEEKIAKRYGFDNPAILNKLFKNYTTNVFAPWSNEKNTREMLVEIASEICTSRTNR